MSSSRSMTLTPTLMLGASTMAMCSACAAISAFCCGVKPVVPMTALHAEFAAHRQVRQRAFGAREVDQHVGAGQRRAQVGADGHAGAAAEEGAGVLAQRRAAGDVQRAGQRAVVAAQHGFDQHAAHAARGPGDGDSQHRRPVRPQDFSSGGYSRTGPIGSAGGASRRTGGGSALRSSSLSSSLGTCGSLKRLIEATNSRSVGSSVASIDLTHVAFEEARPRCGAARRCWAGASVKT